MIRRKSLLLLAGMFVAARLGATATNFVDVAALAACRTGETNGWTLAGIDSYADRTSVRLAEKDDWARSPDYGANVVGFIFKVKSSSQTGRRLSVFPEDGGAPASEAVCRCAYSPNKDTYVWQTLSVPPTCDFSRFWLRLEGTNATGWGFTDLAVVTEEATDRAAAPTFLSLAFVHDRRATASWTNASTTVSNRLVLSRLDTTRQGDVTLEAYDFEFLSAGGNTKSVTDEVTAAYPRLGGERLYAPANSTGLVQISSGSARGTLTHAGFADYAALDLVLTARRYPGDQETMTLSTVAGSVTNLYDTVRLAEDFETQVISLANVPAGAALLFNDASRKTNGRVVVDSIAFSRRGSVRVETNEVRSVTLPADAGSFVWTDLDPATPYVLSLTPYGRLGRPSSAVLFPSFVTLPRPFCLTLR